MKYIFEICEYLDKKFDFELSDKIFTKYAESKKDILKKRILIPSDVKKIIKEAYEKRYDEVRFGNNDMFELAKEITTRSYIELDKILEIHKYTVKHRNTHSNSKKHPSYWTYQLHGGDDGRKWASDIIKIYLPKDWKTN